MLCGISINSLLYEELIIVENNIFQPYPEGISHFYMTSCIFLLGLFMVLRFLFFHAYGTL
jgi:hypothetical protein